MPENKKNLSNTTKQRSKAFMSSCCFLRQNSWLKPKKKSCTRVRGDPRRKKKRKKKETKLMPDSKLVHREYHRSI
jgi:hypothetical protein